MNRDSWRRAALIGYGSALASWVAGVSWFWAIAFHKIENSLTGVERLALQKWSMPVVFIAAGCISSLALSFRLRASLWRRLLPGLLAGVAGACVAWDTWITFADRQVIEGLVQALSYQAEQTYRTFWLPIMVGLIGTVPALVARALLRGCNGEAIRPSRTP